jgi:hypothetical protein
MSSSPQVQKTTKSVPRKPFRPEEDAQLIQLSEQSSSPSWERIAQELEGRTLSQQNKGGSLRVNFFSSVPVCPSLLISKAIIAVSCHAFRFLEGAVFYTLLLSTNVTFFELV